MSWSVLAHSEIRIPHYKLHLSANIATDRKRPVESNQQGRRGANRPPAHSGIPERR